MKEKTRNNLEKSLTDILIGASTYFIFTAISWLFGFPIPFGVLLILSNISVILFSIYGLESKIDKMYKVVCPEFEKV